MLKDIDSKITAASATVPWAAILVVAWCFEYVSIRPLIPYMVAALFPLTWAAGTNHIAVRAQTIRRKISLAERKLRRISVWEWVSTTLSRAYEPSVLSLSIVVLPLTALWLLAHFFQRFSQFLPQAYILKIAESHYQNLIAIHAGIGAVIFAFVIFVAESLRDDETKDRARVLLRESFLFPLTISEILVFFFFIWGEVNIFSVLPIVLVAFGAIIAFWRLIKVLVSRNRFFEKRTKLLVERIGQSIHLAIRERLGTNALLESLGEGKIGLEYYPMTPEGFPEDYHCFESDKKGVIVDIRLDKLGQIARLAESSANRKGFSFYKDRPMPVDTDASTSSTQPHTSGSKKFVQTDFYILKKYESKVGPDDRPLICLPKKAVSEESVVRKIRKLVKDTFIVRERENFSEEIRSEFSAIKDQFVTAVRENQPGKVEELTKTYISVAETFLDQINAYGGGFSYEQAKQELGAWIGEWSEIRWLREDIYEVLKATKAAEDLTVVRSVIYLPFAIAKRAIDRKDHYVFQAFLNFAPMIYEHSFQILDKDVAEFVRERSYTHLKDATEFFVIPDLKRTKDIKLVKEYGDFTKHVLLIFGNLLKTAFDKRDEATFRELCAVIEKLFRRIERDAHPDFMHSESMKSDLSYKTDPTEILAMKEGVALMEAKEGVVRDVIAKRAQLFFGMAAWILDELRKNQSDQTLENLYKEIKTHLPVKLPELTSIFLAAKDFDVQRRWGWDFWGLVADGEVHTIDFSAKLDRFFFIRSLEILADIPDEQARKDKLPLSRSLASMAEANSGEMKFLDSMEAAPARWKPILTDEAISKIDILKKLLRTAGEEQEKEEAKFVMDAELSSAKVSEFIDKMKSAFENAVVIRKIFSTLGKCRDTSSTKALHPEIKMWGYNQVDHKEAFLENWHVHYPGWGSQYGEGLARSEDQFAYKTISDTIVDTVVLPRKDALVDTVLESLEARGLRKPIIIIPGDYRLQVDGLNRSGKFVQKWNQNHQVTGHEEIEAYLGYIKSGRFRIPVFRVMPRDAGLKQIVCVISGEDFGKFYVFPPIEKESDKKAQAGSLFVEIKNFNKDDQDRKKILEQNPEWLRAQANPDRYLRQRVLIRIYEKYELKVIDRAAGFKLVLDIPKADDEDDEE